MPRLIGIFLLLLAGIGLLTWLSRKARGGTGREGKTFRPRFGGGARNSSASQENRGTAEDIYVMSKSSVSSVCDALTGGPINLDGSAGSIWRCVKCSSLYNQSSVAALEKDNAGACVQCQTHVRAAVTLMDD
jgi:hypothetical protein